jgi:hypothetical protein
MLLRSPQFTKAHLNRSDPSVRQRLQAGVCPLKARDATATCVRVGLAGARSSSRAQYALWSAVGAAPAYAMFTMKGDVRPTR